jgi:hypothetical protein
MAAITRREAQYEQARGPAFGRLVFLHGIVSAGPSNAFSLFDQSFSGFVTSARETAPSGPPKTDALMIG